jgi:phosphatidylserine decarboxylase
MNYFHREGYTLIGITLAISALIIVLDIFFDFPIWLSLPTYTLVLFFNIAFLQFFRNPKVETPMNPSHIIAPADGKVVVIERTTESEYFHDERIQVSIFMSPINVHVNRSPISGVVSYFKYHAGKYLVAWHPKASTENERTTIVVKHENGTEILIRQIAGALAKRIKCYVNKGDSVVQGHEFGFIKFGSRVDIFLPTNAVVNVQLNQVTKGGYTVIATLS